jgi:hypothetical protein
VQNVDVKRCQMKVQGLRPIVFVGLAYQCKDIVFRFIIEYSSLRDFGPYVVGLFYVRIFER